MVESKKLYKGYIRTEGKKSLEKLKNRSKFSTYEEIKDCPEFAGVLNTNVIMIDIDDKNESEIMMNMVEDLQLNCRVYQTTRGKHFVFYNSKVENNSIKSTLACGLTADIKIGSKCSYEFIKQEGQERFIEWDIEPEGDYQELPFWMLPIKGTADFVGMDEGQGRNDALFRYILTLQHNGFTVDEIRETISLINHYLFKDSLSEEELSVILRDEAFEKPNFFVKGQFLFNQFGDWLINKENILRVNGQLHLYRDGIYKSGLNRIEKAMLEVIPNLPAAKRTEVLKYLDVKIIENTEQADSGLIAFRNGILDLKTMKVSNFSPDVIITNRIGWDFNPNAYDELMDKTLNNIACNKPDIRKLLEEAVGYSLYRDSKIGKAFFLTGTGSNGKSTYLEVIQALLGEENTSSLDLKKLSDRFSTVMMFGKLANIGDDISDEFVVDTSLFKKIVTGQRIDAEQKGQPKFEFNPYAKLYFSANNIPRMGKGKDWEAIERRMVIIPFNAKFTDKDADYDPEIGKKLISQNAIEYLIRIAVDGLKRVLKNNRFTESEDVRKEMDEFKKSNNPILLFIDDRMEEGKQIAHESTEKVFDDYQGFCVRGGYKPMTKIEFVKAINKALNLKSVYRAKLSQKIFVERDE